MKKKLDKPILTPAQQKKVDEAISMLREMQSSTFAEAEICMDELASCLREIYFGAKTKAFKKKAPSLHEVIEKLESDFGLSDDAVEAAYELKNHIEDTYQENENEDIFYDIEEATEKLTELLEEFIK